MQARAFRKSTLSIPGGRFGQMALASIGLAVCAAACTDDPIVYPNRNLRPAAGAPSGGQAGEAGEASEAGAPSGGMMHGGSGGTGGSGGNGGAPVGGDEAGAAGAAGAPITGPVCGNGVLEPPEECDDGNNVSGDGCSADCVSRCEACEKNLCPTAQGDASFSLYDYCYAAMGRITKGPAAGYKRAEVCGELVDCIRESNCAQTKNYRFEPLRCFCDVDWFDKSASQVLQCQNPETFVPGKCASLFQDASEGSKLADVMSQYTGFTYALGAGYELLASCDARVCTEECLPGYFGHGTAATITEDILVASNTAGESALCDLLADSQRSIAQTDFALAPFNNIASAELTGLLFSPTPHRAADGPGTVLWSEARAVTLGYFVDSYSGGPPPTASFDSQIFKATLTGQKLYDALNQQFVKSSDPLIPGYSLLPSKLLCVSGLSYTWDATKQSPDSPVLEIRKNGVALDKAASYTIALSDRVLATSGPIQALQGLPSPTLVPGAQPEELLGEYLAQLPQPVAPPKLDRITRLPASN